MPNAARTVLLVLISCTMVAVIAVGGTALYFNTRSFACVSDDEEEDEAESLVAETARLDKLTVEGVSAASVALLFMAVERGVPQVVFVRPAEVSHVAMDPLKGDLLSWAVNNHGCRSLKELMEALPASVRVVDEVEADEGELNHVHVGSKSIRDVFSLADAIMGPQPDGPIAVTRSCRNALPHMKNDN